MAVATSVLRVPSAWSCPASGRPPEYGLVDDRVPPVDRLARLRAREAARYGREVIAPGGARYDSHVEFLSWAGGYDTGGVKMRSQGALHEAGLLTLPGVVRRLEGDRPVAPQRARIEMRGRLTHAADKEPPMTLGHAPSAKAEMLIRKPVAEVFEAFVDPAITSRFWFTRGSGRLERDKQVTWDWEMYGVSAQVSVKAVERNRRILIEWTAYGAPTTVEWIFTPLGDDTTFVSITNTGFSGDGDAIAEQAISSTEGFALVLAGLKARLEHGIRLNLVADRFPKDLRKP